MDDLITWLRQQLDADERVIGRNRGERGLGDDAGFPDYRTYDGEDIDAACDYIGQFAPPRMQTEIDAKRRLLVHIEVMIGYATSPNYAHSGIEAWAHAALGMLALPYADRPGYRQEWRP